jgi:hypothetical protein
MHFDVYYLILGLKNIQKWNCSGTRGARLITEKGMNN